jgi:2-polyprenyl-6-methoxyphenol hydroxylase-like FAD-dependent oxidoreductase
LRVGAEQMTSVNAPIVIVGGGVAGLALAKGLIDRNVDVRVLDRGWLPFLRGMGFILLRSGYDALLDLFPKVPWREIGAPVTNARIMSRTGAVLSETELDAYAIGRGTLLDTMMQQLPRGTLIDHARVAEFMHTSDGRVLALKLRDGRVMRCSMVVGADGVNSATRNLLYPDLELAEVRVREVVSIFDAPHVAEILGTTFLKYYDTQGGLAVGMLNVGRGKVVWFVQHDASRYDWSGLNPAMIRWALWRKLEGWPNPIPALWAMTKFTDSHLWSTRDMYPSFDYVRGNVVLIGDAAHPVLSFTSHGATGALEDAVLLAPLIAEAKDDEHREELAAAFGKVRRDMFTRIVEGGRAIQDRFMLPLNRQPEGIILPLVK